MGPEIIEPTRLPPTNMPLTTPIAAWADPGGRCLRTRMNESGSAPTIAPCRICPASSTGRLGASDDTRPPASTTVISRVMTRLPPKRSPRVPETGSRRAPLMSSAVLSKAPWAGLKASSRCSSGSVGVSTDSRAPVAMASRLRAPMAAFPMPTGGARDVVMDVLSWWPGERRARPRTAAGGRARNRSAARSLPPRKLHYNMYCSSLQRSV